MTIFFFLNLSAVPKKSTPWGHSPTFDIFSELEKTDKVWKKTSPSSMLKFPKGGFPLSRNFCVRTH